ncbi:unnamed protein product (macronuclear) [Paramecium tetraurelia]|uniref:Uncharacterized protein n=1 Tax=Paramecium tetraurelia TaxID=5888 RepID=A0DBU9_PARTE|nr:uncharacterized protein GSPATT00015393001 [Paramecium tetraurelia]CAK80516.1 unnamed protein product [Paramecium tetraurelia]|eukprot:XP_001447913.1 hypothetical protein (macronuclear) [Paramecium tetraurelia strain d4-2]
MNKLEILNSPRLTTQTEHVKKSFYSRDIKSDKNFESSSYHQRTYKNEGRRKQRDYHTQTNIQYKQIKQNQIFYNQKDSFILKK